MVELHLESCFTDYSMDAANPIENITEYCIKIEFQAHGSPHTHYLLWVKDVPVLHEEAAQKTYEEVC